MGPRFDDGLLPSRAIYPKQRGLTYNIALIICKVFKAFGIYLVYDLLKLVHIVPFVFIIKLGSALGFFLLQRPSCRGIQRHQLFRIIRHAVVSSFISLLWLFGLTLCGPFRTILLFEHNPVVIVAGASAIFKSVGGPSKFRGAVFFVIALLGILLFDHDDFEVDGTEAFHPEGQHSGILRHTFYHFLSWSGLSDHKGGVVLLVMTLLTNVIFQNQSKKLSVDLGGAKRLQALSTALSSLILFPWAMFVHWNTESVTMTLTSGILPFSIVIISVVIVDYYMDAVANNKLEADVVAKLGSFAIFTAGFLFSVVWNHPFIEALTTLNTYKELITEDHLLSGGVIFSLVLMYFATSILSSSSRATDGKGSFIGYSSTGQPLYSFAEETIQRTTHSIMTVLRGGLKQILEESNSRKIFYFLLLNLSFTAVELVWGAWTNSLGLISDGFHMLFDCSALVVGLYAAIMSRWKATRVFSFGYDRIEVLSGFVNGLFLVVVSFFILLAAISRLLHPPHINTDKLLTVSVLGLLVNLFGIAAFSHAHSHGGGSHSHGGGHSHSQDGGSHSHKSSHSHSLSKDSNMRGVFLHVLADTLGSVGVIISTLLIEYFDWNFADPLCSIFIGVMIFLSVLPLLSDTADVLLLRVPKELMVEIQQALNKILGLEGVLSYREHHFWRHSSNTICGKLHIQIAPKASEQIIVTQATAILRNIGIKNLTIQAEKEEYYQHLMGLNSATVIPNGSNTIMHIGDTRVRAV